MHLRDGVAVIFGMVDFQLIKVFARIKKRWWACHWIERHQMGASSTLLHELWVEDYESFIN
jgi:hypothetical protein